MSQAKPIELFSPHSKQRLIIDAIESPGNFFTTVVAGRRIGKTILMENFVVKWAIENKGTKIWWVSPTDKQALKVYEDIITAIQSTGQVKTHKRAKGDMEITFLNGSRIEFKSAGADDSLRGSGVSYMVIDEAACIPERIINTVLLPMFITGGKKMVCISTPKSKNWLYNWYVKGLDKTKNPKYDSFRFSSYDSPYANKEILDEVKLTMFEKEFQQEIMAEFVDSSAIFANVDECMILDKQLVPIVGEDYYAGIDIGLVNDASVMVIMNKAGDIVNYFRWEQYQTPDLIKEIVYANTIWKFRKILIENNNQGLPIYQTLKLQLNNIDDFNTSTRTKPEIINELVHRFNMKSIKLFRDTQMEIEFKSFIFKQSPTGHIKFQADNGMTDDIVMAAAICNQCNKVYAPVADFKREIRVWTPGSSMKTRWGSSDGYSGY